MTDTLTPEHDKRRTDGPGLHSEILAAYDYVDEVMKRAPWLLYGWAIREAFLAGCSYAQKATKP